MSSLGGGIPSLYNQPTLGLTAWPACHLPSAPGDIVLVDDPADGEGQERATCDERLRAIPSLSDSAGPGGARPAQARHRDARPRRPRRGRRAVAPLAAAGLLRRLPGRALAAARGAERRDARPARRAARALPRDGQRLRQPQRRTRRRSRRATSRARAASRYAAGTLYVADPAAPVIHVIDMHDSTPQTVAAFGGPHHPLQPRRAGPPPAQLGGEPGARRLRQQGLRRAPAHAGPHPAVAPPQGLQHLRHQPPALPLRDRLLRRERDGLRRQRQLDDAAPPRPAAPGVQPLPAARPGEVRGAGGGRRRGPARRPRASIPSRASRRTACSATPTRTRSPASRRAARATSGRATGRASTTPRAPARSCSAASSPSPRSRTASSP